MFTMNMLTFISAIIHVHVSFDFAMQKFLGQTNFIWFLFIKLKHFKFLSLKLLYEIMSYKIMDNSTSQRKITMLALK